MLNRFLFIFFLFIITGVNAQKKVIPNNPNYQFQSEKNNNTQTQTTQTQAQKPVRQYKSIYQPTWSFGGNIGLAFWSGGGNVILAPKAYYHFSPMFFTGFGLTYMYSKSTYYYSDYSSSVNSFGGSVMLGARPIQYLQLTATYEGLNSNYSNGPTFWNNALYLGASFVTGHVAFGFQYDVLYNSETSPYSSAWGPVISFYF